MTDEKILIGNLLSEYPLYKKLSIPHNGNYLEIGGFTGITFNHECKVCKKDRTFITKSYGATQSWDVSYAFIDGHKENGKRSISDFYKGVCQGCFQYNIDLTIRADEVSKPATDMRSVEPGTEATKENYPEMFGEIAIRKIGQYPRYKVKHDKIVEEYLTEEDNSLYTNALECIAKSLGIAAFAYLRRIAENEIVRIIKDVADDGNEKVMSAYEMYLTNRQMKALISAISAHLPPSLNSLGENPFAVLHSLTSEGMHSLTDNECLEKALTIKDIFFL